MWQVQYESCKNTKWKVKSAEVTCNTLDMRSIAMFYLSKQQIDIGHQNYEHNMSYAARKNTLKTPNNCKVTSRKM